MLWLMTLGYQGKDTPGNFPAVQWLGLHASPAGGTGLIPGRGTKILHHQTGSLPPTLPSLPLGPCVLQLWCSCHLLIATAGDQGPIGGSSFIPVLTPQLPVLLTGLWDKESHIPLEILPSHTSYTCMLSWSLPILQGCYRMGRREKKLRAQGLTCWPPGS